MESVGKGGEKRKEQGTGTLLVCSKCGHGQEQGFGYYSMKSLDAKKPPVQAAQHTKSVAITKDEQQQTALSLIKEPYASLAD